MYVISGVMYVRADVVERNKTKDTTLRPVGFEPTRFGETVGLKSTPLDHSGRSAYVMTWQKQRFHRQI